MQHKYRVLALVSLWVLHWAAIGQERVTYDTKLNAESLRTPAIFGSAKIASGTPAKVAAVVLIHSAGGARDGTTGPLARALNAGGIATLELQLFDLPQERQTADRDMARVFGALKMLAARPDVDPKRVGLAGFSYGAHFTLWAASQWSVSQRFLHVFHWRACQVVRSEQG